MANPMYPSATGAWSPQSFASMNNPIQPRKRAKNCDDTIKKDFLAIITWEQIKKMYINES